ncbi:MAG: tripartite tricarboxylate transporter substrate binding protein [Burkholderiales bacterium]|nr:tripartite tricarboxylate transporter substrate binding protein [Burkholderiales bacterium]
MRKLFLKAAAAMVALAASTMALAQADWPNKQITIVVGFSPGGSTDFVARIMADEFRKTWGQAVVVENKPGAGGNIGANLVAKAKPDGYTLLMGSVGPLAINATLYANMPYDNIKDFQPVSQVVGAPNMLVVNPASLPAKDFPDFLRLLKASPNKYFYASTGIGTSAHLSGELLKSMTGVEITHVPYKGAVALNDLLSGEQVHFMFATIPSVIQHVRSGRLRGIAVTTRTRSASSPDLPTIAELGYPDFEASSWFGLLGPAGMPREIAMKIQAEVVRILKIPEIREKLVQQGVDPVGSTPDEFAAYIKSETEKWAKVVRMAGAKAN